MGCWGEAFFEKDSHLEAAAAILGKCGLLDPAMFAKYSVHVIWGSSPGGPKNLVCRHSWEEYNTLLMVMAEMKPEVLHADESAIFKLCVQMQQEEDCVLKANIILTVWKTLCLHCGARVHPEAHTEWNRSVGLISTDGGYRPGFLPNTPGRLKIFRTMAKRAARFTPGTPLRFLFRTPNQMESIAAGSSADACSHCHRGPAELGPNILKVCGRCMMARYCSVACQQTAWLEGHWATNTPWWQCRRAWPTPIVIMCRPSEC